MKAVIVCDDKEAVAVNVTLDLAEVEALRNAIGWLFVVLDGPRAPLEKLRALLESIEADF